jgi:hypothetical protein
MRPVDWAALVSKLGPLRADGESVTSDDARKALELLLGPEMLRTAVDYYCDYGKGSERGTFSR